MLFDVFDRVLHGRDLFGSVIRDFHAEGFFECHHQFNGIKAIRAQVAPCWNPPVGGRDVRRMTVIVTVSYSRDGRVIGMPQAGTPSGMTAANADYARAFAETARRAVLRCQPLKLPATNTPAPATVSFCISTRKLKFTGGRAAEV